DRELGQGGMATVWLAGDLRHDRQVALKVLRPELAAVIGADRFLAEIRTTARLNHPHILPLFDSGEADGRVFFTMPFVEGESLRERLRREPRLPIEDALRIATEAARGLDYAHQHGVIHRDIKPENILLTRDGTTLVADFGIARAGGTAEGLTRTGVPLGTPAYISPEQADDAAVDARADQYALAVVLWEMLAGEPPFTGRSLHAIVAKRIKDPLPSVRARRPDVPPGVEEVILKAMAPAPGDRFATVAELAQALRGTVTGTTPTPTAAATPARPARRRRVPVVAMALVAGLLIGIAAVAVWRMGAGAARPEGGPPVVAVLPFENLGDSADAYFADGVSDEIRTKLAQLAGLAVIARGSSIEYRRTAARPTAIARELGADYLLSGTVRWDKATGDNRVRVTPELVDARTGQAARTRWVQQFDASLTDVFQVQADIATRVADALGVALADSARRELGAKPTESLAAWDEFLKGEAASGAMKGDQASLRRAAGHYERAVALDSGFVQAWTQLSRARTSLYSNGVPDPELGEQARLAAERARRLAPDDPAVYLALGDYYGSITPIDNERAAAEYERGLRLAPANVDLLGAAAMTETSLGRWDDAPARLARASQLDPRSANAVRRLAVVQTFLRNYRVADSAADRSVALAPDNLGMISLKVLVALGRGDLDSARAVIRTASRRIDDAVLLSFFASYQDLYWVLNDAQQRQVLAMSPAPFDGDRAVWGLVQAQLSHHRGDLARARAYADSARVALEEQTRAAPEDGQRRVLLGVALAYLGRKAEAVREGRRGVKLLPMARDAYFGPYVQLQLARIHLLNGDPEPALDQLEPLLRVPFYLSSGWLRIDPTFDPLRKHPRFRKLAEPEQGDPR
ncbi:MAG TPA: protein kinase, partial [Gemmatimonadales bacterium]|nr:protein kinase [Gemmatimonadales bacterium]